jgi:hypothetical protein
MIRLRALIATACLLVAAPLVALAVEKTVLDNGVERWAVPAAADGLPYFFQRYAKLTGLDLPPATDLPFGRSIAFLVGVGKYSNFTTQEQLPYVQRDIDDLRDYLISEGGFDEVLLVRDEKATPELIEHYMMDDFPRRLGRRDRLLFYFSGHGTDAGGATGYILLSDAKKGQFSHSVIAISRVQEWSRVLRADHALFLFDSCASGLGIAAKKTDFDSDKQLLRTLSRNGSRNVITAGTAEESTFEISDVQGRGGEVFTRALLEALTTPTLRGPYSSLLTVSQVFGQLELNVKRWAALQGQNLTPRIWPLDPNDYRGSFVFLNPASAEPVSEDIVNSLKARRKDAAGVTAVSWKDFAVSFGSGARQGKRLVLSTGLSPINEQRQYAFRVQNLTGRPARLEMRVEGKGLEAAWEGGLLSRLLDPHATGDLEVKVVVGEILPSDGIVFLVEGQEVFSLGFELQAKQAVENRETSSGNRSSGQADQWSQPYTLCLGPAPAGYTLDVNSAEYFLTGDRRCGAWAECRWLQRDDANVCFEFKLQGHNEFSAMVDRLGVRDSEGHLRARYRLVPGTPRLREVTLMVPSAENSSIERRPVQ